MFGLLAEIVNFQQSPAQFCSVETTVKVIEEKTIQKQLTNLNITSNPAGAPESQ